MSAGWIHGFWETDLQPYDIAAAMVMLEETGMLCTNVHGEPYNMFTDKLMVAAQPVVHAELLERVQAGYLRGE